MVGCYFYALDFSKNLYNILIDNQPLIFKFDICAGVFGRCNQTKPIQAEIPLFVSVRNIATVSFRRPFSSIHAWFGNAEEQ